MHIKLKCFLAFLMVGSTFLVEKDLQACSRIFWNNRINKVAARTTDLYVDEKPTFEIRPRGLKQNGQAGPNSLEWVTKYGSVVVTAFGKAVSEGLNEKGLGVHLLYLHDTEYEPRDGRPGVSNTLWAQYILDTCASVNEAVQSLNTFQVVSTAIAGREWPLHVCLEDPSGDSAIIEFVKGKLVVHHGPQYTVMTNEPAYDIQIKNLQRYRYFGGTLPLPGDIDSMSRFVRCAAFLKTLPQPENLLEAIGHAYGVIRTVQVAFGAVDTSSSSTVSEDTWPTRWASALDVTNLVYYFSSTSAPNIVWVNLKQLDFSAGQPVRELNLQNPSLVGEVSNQFTPIGAPTNPIQRSLPKAHDRRD